jgi:hypothetical protein
MVSYRRCDRQAATLKERGGRVCVPAGAVKFSFRVFVDRKGISMFTDEIKFDGTRKAGKPAAAVSARRVSG